MTTLDKFRRDYLLARERTGMKQLEIEASYKVPQTVISRLECGVCGLSFDNIVKLWPFVYGVPFRFPETEK